MSAVSGTVSVLFDVPGPRARRRYLIGGIIGTIVLVALLAWVVVQFAATGQFSAKKWDILTYQTVQLTLLNGYLGTVSAAAVAAVLAVALGAVLAVGRLSDHSVIRGPSFGVVELFRAVPLVLLMFLFYYGAPTIGLSISPFWAVVLGLMLYNGSVLAEIFRAGVDSVPKGQAEAGYAIGMTKTQVMISILFPQAIRTMLPSIISQLVVLLKDTALGFLITYDDLLKEVKQLGSATQFDLPLIPLAIVGGTIYIATCLVLSGLANWLERRGRSPKRRPKKTAAGTAAGAPTQ